MRFEGGPGLARHREIYPRWHHTNAHSSGDDERQLAPSSASEVCDEVFLMVMLRRETAESVARTVWRSANISVRVVSDGKARELSTTSSRLSPQQALGCLKALGWVTALLLFIHALGMRRLKYCLMMLRGAHPCVGSARRTFGCLFWVDYSR